MSTKRTRETEEEGEDVLPKEEDVEEKVVEGILNISAPGNGGWFEVLKDCKDVNDIIAKHGPELNELKEGKTLGQVIIDEVVAKAGPLFDDLICGGGLSYTFHVKGVSALEYAAPKTELFTVLAIHTMFPFTDEDPVFEHLMRYLELLLQPHHHQDVVITLVEAIKKRCQELMEDSHVEIDEMEKMTIVPEGEPLPIL
jgi:hypothetical protein